MAKETINLFSFLEEMKIWVSVEGKERLIVEIFYNPTEYFLNKEDDPYRFIETHEQRGDGDGYETFFVFERKSDGKFFYYYIYDGMIEEYELVECEKIVKTTWSFDLHY